MPRLGPNVEKDLPVPDSSFPSKLLLPDSHGPSSLWAVLPTRGRTDLSFTSSGGDVNKEKNGPNLGSSQGKRERGNYEASGRCQSLYAQATATPTTPWANRWGEEKLLAQGHPARKGQRWAGREPQSPEMHTLSPTPHGLQKREPRTWTTPGPSASTAGFPRPHMETQAHIYLKKKVPGCRERDSAIWRRGPGALLGPRHSQG